MNVTGERYLPEFDADWTLEHVHRYLLAREFAVGKITLDVACGDGYGSRMLAEIATCVVGVDISFETVCRARRKYPHPSLNFVMGNASAVPLADSSVDLVVSFETIEHLTEQEAMLSEIRRVLRPDGLLLVSSPDKREYSDIAEYHNEFHVKELYRDEFVSLLAARFKKMRLVGQRVLFGSVMGAEDGAPFLSWRKNALESRTNGLVNAEYFIALAGDGFLPKIPSGVMTAPVAVSDCASSLTRRLEQAQGELLSERKAFEEHKAALEAHRFVLEKHLRDVREELQGVYASRSWKVTAPLRSAVSGVRTFRARLKNAMPHRPCIRTVWPPDVRALETKVILDETVAPSTTRVGVFLHVYYTELVVEMAECLHWLPETAQIHASTDTEAKRDVLSAFFSAQGLAHRTDIRVFPNRGWDIAPFLVGFGDCISRYPLILRLHSKRSTFIPGNVGDAWRAMLYATLAGSGKRVNAVMNAFEQNNDLGMICPPNPSHYADSLTIGKNYGAMGRLLASHGVSINPDTPVDFPMGSMFWCRPAVLSPWLEKGLSFEDFSETNPKERDGTLAHALERLFFFGCGITSHSWARIEME